MRSPFLGFAILASALNYSQWLQPLWVDKVEALIPSLLGFSLGTYTLVFSIMSGRLKGALRSVKSPHGADYLETINATFFHFIFIQVVTLTWAFLYQGTWLFDFFRLLSKSSAGAMYLFMSISYVGSFVGYFLMVYSVMLVVASALAVYRLALIRDPAETGNHQNASDRALPSAPPIAPE